MAVFNPAANRPLQGGRGGASGVRFLVYALISAALMFFDHSQHYLEQLRYLLQGITFPVELAVSSPAKAVTWAQENMQAIDVLKAENAQLRARQHELEQEVIHVDALEKENGQLRGLRDALPPVVDRWLVGEVVQVQLDSLRSRILVNRGANNGVKTGQTVMDDAGIIGQTTHVGPWSSEVILITDPEHAIPVKVERIGQRPPGEETLYTIAVGTGDKASLGLPYLAANEDIKPGDRLVTSGLGGVFPAGYPVAKVTEVNRDKSGTDRIKAVPYAHCCAAISPYSFTGEREVMLVWFREGQPTAPVEVADGELKTGNEAMQPIVREKPKEKEREKGEGKDKEPVAAAAPTPGASPLVPASAGPAQGAAATHAAAAPRPAAASSSAAPRPTTSSSAKPASASSASVKPAPKPAVPKPAVPRPAAPKPATPKPASASSPAGAGPGSAASGSSSSKPGKQP